MIEPLVPTWANLYVYKCATYTYSHSLISCQLNAITVSAI